MQAKSQQNKKDPSRSKAGQLIIEATVATSIMVVGLLGIFVLISRSLNMYHTAAQEYVAINLAAEGIEVTKNILDANLINGRAWNYGFAVTEAKYYGIQYNSTTLVNGSENKYLFYDPATGLYSYDTDTGNQSVYRRVVTITNAPEDEIQVNSVVTYKISAGAKFEINLEDHFYNWR